MGLESDFDHKGFNKVQQAALDDALAELLVALQSSAEALERLIMRLEEQNEQ